MADEDPRGLILPPEDRLLRVGEVCELLGICQTLVYRMGRQGLLRSVKIGRSRRWRLSDVESAMQTGLRTSRGSKVK